MAFATTNVNVASVGNLNCLVGNWTGAIGDASGTVSIKGGNVYLVSFYNQDASSQEDRPTPCDISYSSGTITITVHNHSGVTTGRFIVIYA